MSSVRNAQPYIYISKPDRRGSRDIIQTNHGWFLPINIDRYLAARSELGVLSQVSKLAWSPDEARRRVVPRVQGTCSEPRPGQVKLER